MGFDMKQGAIFWRGILGAAGLLLLLCLPITAAAQQEKDHSWRTGAGVAALLEPKGRMQPEEETGANAGDAANTGDASNAGSERASDDGKEGDEEDETGSLVMADVSNVLNVRTEPDSEAELAGYLRLFAPALICFVWIALSHALLNSNQRFIPGELIGVNQSVILIALVVLLGAAWGVKVLAVGFCLYTVWNTLYLTVCSYANSKAMAKVGNK